MFDLLILLVLYVTRNLLRFHSWLGLDQLRRAFAWKHLFRFLLNQLQSFFLVVAVVARALEKGDFIGAVCVGRGGWQSLA